MSHAKSTFLVIAEIAVFAALAFLYLTVGIHSSIPVRIITKLLPILMIIISLTASVRHSGSKVILLPVIALVFSAIGDAFGELKGTGIGLTAFKLQIVSFAVAQIVYGVSFLRYFSFRRSHRLVYDLLALGTVGFFVWFAMTVMPHIGHGMETFAMVYFIVLLFMALSAMMQQRSCHWTFAVGAILFFLSDSAIAYGQYVHSFPHRALFVMSTYYAAQLLLNVSLFKSHR